VCGVFVILTEDPAGVAQTVGQNLRDLEDVIGALTRRLCYGSGLERSLLLGNGDPQLSDLRPDALRSGMDADNRRDARERLRCAGSEALEGAQPVRDRQRPHSLRASSDVLRGHPAARRNVAMARLFCRPDRRNRTDGTDRNRGDACGEIPAPRTPRLR
jgi:hypothetical protein